MPYYYVKFLGGAAKVDHYVGLGPVYHGSTLDGLGPVVSLLVQVVPGASQIVAGFCGSCPEGSPGSPFLNALDPSWEAPPGAVILFVAMLAIWWKLRKGRLEHWEIGKLEFEEIPEAAVLTLSIERD